MKINKQNYKIYKLLKFNLVKSEIIDKELYEKNLLEEDIEIRLKKALNLIYLYHISNKKILFIGNPLNINKKLITLLKNKKHVFIPKSAWVSGMLTNRYSFLKSNDENNKNKMGKKVFKLKRTGDLIVILDKIFNSEALKESYLCGLPIITLNSDLNPFEIESSYKVPGNFTLFKNRIKENFFYSILVSILKKATEIKKKFPSLVHTMSTLKAIKKKRYQKWYQPKFKKWEKPKFKK